MSIERHFIDSPSPSAPCTLEAAWSLSATWPPKLKVFYILGREKLPVDVETVLIFEFYIDYFL
jgi:hypothetical protein